MYLFLLIFLVGCYAFTSILRVRDGDCVDRAIQYKQELIKRGYKTRLMLGLVNEKGHAWLEYKDKRTGEWKRMNNLRGKMK